MQLIAGSRGIHVQIKGPAQGPRYRLATRRWHEQHQDASAKRVVISRARDGSGGDDDEAPPTTINQLQATIKRKSRQVEAKLLELGMEALEERLQSGVQVPATPQYRLARLIADLTEMQGRAALVMEISRPSSASPAEDLAKLAQQYVACGADALAVRIDAEDTPEGLKDLYVVCQSVKVPVLARDWVIHPLQVVEAKEAGAAGIIGIVHQVNGRGTPVMSSFAAALGLDAPVEVVNLQEVELMARSGVVFYGINLGVGLSISVPGFASQMAHGLLGQMPFGAISLVGVRTFDEASRARASGADALLVKKEMVEVCQQQGMDVQSLISRLQYAVGGDD